LFITTLFAIVKLWKQPRCPRIDEQIKKTFNGVLFRHEEE
jgi:hypothetical protein